jgi:hypothetical protein
MADNLLIEIRKDNFFKNRKYCIDVDGINQGQLTFFNSRKFLSLDVGRHIVSIQCDDYLIQNEIIVKRTDKFKRFYIKPTISLQLSKGVSIGFWTLSVCFILYSYFVLNTKISFPIVIALLFPLLFSTKNKKNNANFIIQK